MTPEQRKDYWLENLTHAERSVEVARREYLKAVIEIGRTGVDEMLLGQDPPITNENWPGATDMGEYLDRTIPDVSGRDL